MTLPKPIIIAFWIQKGGAAKTTHAVNFASMLASKGYKTLLVDADPQCDSTFFLCDNMVHPADSEIDNYNAFLNEGLTREEIASKVPRTLFESIEAVRLDTPGGIRAIKSKLIFNWPGKGGLWLIPGSRNFSRWDVELGYANANLEKPHYKKYPGAIYDAVMKSSVNLQRDPQAPKETADFIIFDLSASSGLLNCCLYMSSHFTIMPVVPDKLTVHDIKISLDTITDWHKLAKEFINKTAEHSHYPFPPHLPKFLGYIIGRYDIGGLNNFGKSGCKGSIGENGVVEDDSVPNNVKFLFDLAHKEVESIIPYFRGMSPPLVLDSQKLFNLANIRTFNQCGQLSQLLGIPICLLSKEDMVKYNNERAIERMGAGQAKNTMITVKEFKEIYNALANNVISLIQSAGFKINHYALSEPLKEIPKHIVDIRSKFPQVNSSRKKAKINIKDRIDKKLGNEETSLFDELALVSSRQLPLSTQKRGPYKRKVTMPEKD